ncbi:hypothetical protein P43SY_010834 [Pythium insidiosum]|uniref:Macro domain-containing protein n=1 Tax=Pythium insidiosum TaxID=114742 RepID=A0AAD5L661_PYTIN|nr:hypothetical protein P43SY_010834 [Pythium insidiosum]
MHGDLTTATTGAIVNPANEELSHGGGLAREIVQRAGDIVRSQSQKYIEKHGKLPLGHAMSTKAGKLPCRAVIHTVGPRIPRRELPTAEHACALRSAVSNVLLECERLGLESIAIPGISTGSFRYPPDLGAREIVAACELFCSERAEHPGPIKRIELMNNDTPTVLCFVTALREAAAQRDQTVTTRDDAEPGTKASEADRVH